MIKLHASVGVKTHVMTSVAVTSAAEGDSPQLAGLVNATAKRFALAEVSGDKAYLSHNNLKTIEDVGAVPFIPFKLNSHATGSEAWERMHAMFTLRKADFLRSYHRRSNVETAFSSIKRKFGSAVRAKGETAQQNEVLCKLLCHNLSVLVHSFHELGIEPSFWTETDEAAQ